MKRLAMLCPAAFCSLALVLLCSCRGKGSADDVAASPSGAGETINVGVSAFFEPFGIERRGDMNFILFDSAEDIFSRLLSGDLDIGYVPSECFEKLARVETLGAAVVPLGPRRRERFFLVARTDALADGGGTGDPFDDMRRRGQKALCFNFSISSYYRALGSVLDVLDFSLANDALIPALVSGKSSFAVLPLEYALLAERKSPLVRRERELDAAGGFDFPEVVLAANGRFSRTHADYIRGMTEGRAR